ncbi:MAG: HAD family hydrolase [Ardenticatenaceae bacterium]|nr:HAD family hydrolase [Ardenticatenaceae bacterium]
MAIQAVIFDLGGTLIEYAGAYATWPDLETPGFQAAYGVLAEQGVELPPFAQFRDTGFGLLPSWWRRATLGEQNLRLVDLLTAVLHTHTSNHTNPEWLIEAAEQYQTAVCGQAHAFTDAQPILDTVKSQGYKVGLLSNTMFTGAAHKKDLHRFGLIDYFDTMLFSADVGKWKPTADPFLHVAEELGVEPETAVYIGDDPGSDVVGGQRAGMRTIHVQSSQRFPHPAGVEPDARVTRLGEITAVLAQWQGTSSK